MGSRVWCAADSRTLRRSGLILVGGILWLFYRDQLREAWQQNGV